MSTNVTSSTSNTTIYEEDKRNILSIILLTGLTVLVLSIFYIFFSEIKSLFLNKRREEQIQNYVNGINQFNPIYNDVNKDFDQQCAICIGSDKKNLVSLECGHNFHKTCIIS